MNHIWPALIVVGVVSLVVFPLGFISGWLARHKVARAAEADLGEEIHGDVTRLPAGAAVPFKGPVL